MTPLEIYQDYQEYLDVDNDSWADPANIWRNLYQAQNEIVRLIGRVSPSYFVRSTSLSIVSGTALYSLPLNARLGSKIVLTEDVDDELALNMFSWENHLDFEGGGLLSLVASDSMFTLERNQIRISPTPTGSDTYRIWYIPVFGNMLQGSTAVAATTTTFTGWTSAPNFTTNYGVIDTRADYYNGMNLEVLSGNGVGEVHEITDFSGGATPVFTIGGFTVVPNTTSVVAVQCPVPEDFQYLVAVRAAMKGAVKQRNRLSDLRTMWNEGKTEMLGWVPNRNAKLVEPDYTQGAF